MLRFVLRRVLYMIPTLFAISIVIFIIIQLPPGDIVTSLLARRRGLGDTMSVEDLEAIRAFYGVKADASLEPVLELL